MSLDRAAKWAAVIGLVLLVRRQFQGDKTRAPVKKAGGPKIIFGETCVYAIDPVTKKRKIVCR